MTEMSKAKHVDLIVMRTPVVSKHNTLKKKKKEYDNSAGFLYILTHWKEPFPDYLFK